MTTDKHTRLREIAAGLGDLLVEKQKQYGDSVGSTSEILRLLYPNGIRPDQYDDLQVLVRVLDKLKRIASRGPDGKDRGGENPWQDVAGYAVLALELAERRQRERIPSVGAASIARMDAATIKRLGLDTADMLAACDSCGYARREHADSMTNPICPNPVSDTCHGCKHLSPPQNDYSTLGRCRKTNRGAIDAQVLPDYGKPTWCPGKETE